VDIPEKEKEMMEEGKCKDSYIYLYESKLITKLLKVTEEKIWLLNMLKTTRQSTSQVCMGLTSAR
jgi:hypothetical protein